jgi:hypothetical protein
MAIYEMRPVIEIRVLEEAIYTQFNVDCELRSILFYDDYMNDCYKSYYFADDEEYKGYCWQDEERIRIRNLVNAYLRDILPGHDSVLIDVSW